MCTDDGKRGGCLVIYQRYVVVKNVFAVEEKM